MKHKNILVVFFLSIALSTFCVIPKVYGTPKGKLKQVLQKIRVLQSNLKETQKKQTIVNQQLKKTEVAIGSFSVATKRTKSKLSDKKATLLALKARQSDYMSMLESEQQRLMSELRSAYALVNDSHIKLLLNNKDQSEISRLRVYYQYIMNERSNSVNSTKHTLQKLHNHDKKTQYQMSVLSDLYERQQSEKHKLEKIKKERVVTLKAIDKDLKTKQTKLQKLLADKKALETLLAKLRSRKKPSISLSSISTLRGNLLSPTRGKAANAFGVGETSLDGVLIDASYGQEVYAIADGKVVFADLLPGYGLLMIIDHGHGYMSLYGRNNNLYKKTGENLKKGNMIATVGKSGGYDKPGLYFAMRYNGKPIDPMVWCKLQKI